jgi:hypothetical protein
MDVDRGVAGKAGQPQFVWRERRSSSRSESPRFGGAFRNDEQSGATSDLNATCLPTRKARRIFG